jgi:hypothetical protein
MAVKMTRLMAAVRSVFAVSVGRDAFRSTKSAHFSFRTSLVQKMLSIIVQG